MQIGELAKRTTLTVDAIRFYEKQGYRRTGAIEDFYGMPLHEFVKELS